MPLAYAHHPIAAHLIRSLLEESGVPAVVEGEHGAAMVVMISNTSTTILVGESNYARGLEVLAEVQSAAAERPGTIPKCPFCAYDMSGLQTTICPECGQDLDVWTRLSSAFALASPPGANSRMQSFGVWLGWGVALLALVLVTAFAVRGCGQ